MSRSVGVGRKENRDKVVTYQNKSNTYGSDQDGTSKTGKYDKNVLSTKPEKRGRKKAGQSGKSKENYKTSGQKVRGRRATKQTRAKKGGKK